MNRIDPRYARRSHRQRAHMRSIVTFILIAAAIEVALALAIGAMLK